MERILTSFVRALRSAGAEVSSAEAIDAARALALVGYGDRLAMRDALCASLAKSEEDIVIHNRLFDQYFSRPDTPPPGASKAADPTADEQQAGSDAGGQPGDGPPGERQPGGERAGGGGRSEGGQGQASAADEAVDDDPTDERPALQRLAESGDPARIAAAIERAGAAAGVDDIRFQSQTAYFVRRILEHLGLEELENRLSARMRERTAQAEADVEAMIAARQFIQRHARTYVDQRFELFGKSATEAFMNEVVAERAIGALSVRDMERMKAVVAKMAKRLAVRHSRRRPVRNRGQLDIRRTLRANAGHDGMLFDLVWRRKHRDRPKIVAICDVSGSVATYVRFLLLFLHTLHDTVTDLRAFAFSNKLVDVGRILETMSFEAAMQRIVEHVGSGSTDYGQAFEDLHEHHWDVIDRRTTVLVLGDGRSNYGEPRVDILQEASERAKRVVWLCPEPAVRWGTGDSVIPQYRPFCSPMTHCATAIDLEQALDDILLAYD